MRSYRLTSFRIAYYIVRRMEHLRDRRSRNLRARPRKQFVFVVGGLLWDIGCIVIFILLSITDGLEISSIDRHRRRHHNFQFELHISNALEGCPPNYSRQQLRHPHNPAPPPPHWSPPPGRHPQPSQPLASIDPTGL